MRHHNGKQQCNGCDSVGDILRIVGKMIGAITGEEKNIQQTIAEELSDIMSLERCVIFKVAKSQEGQSCRIIAGTPEGGHKIGLIEPLANHPDLLEVFSHQSYLHVKNPQDNQATSYFRGIILEKGISEILYLPLVIGKKVKGIIVLDAVDGQSFSEGDIYFCTCIADLISMTLDREEVLRQKWRDIILNQLMVQGGFAGIISKALAQIYEAADKIKVSGLAMEEIFRKEEENGL